MVFGKSMPTFRHRFLSDHSPSNRISADFAIGVDGAADALRVREVVYDDLDARFAGVGDADRADAKESLGKTLGDLDVLHFVVEDFFRRAAEPAPAFGGAFRRDDEGSRASLEGPPTPPAETRRGTEGRRDEEPRESADEGEDSRADSAQCEDEHSEAMERLGPDDDGADGHDVLFRAGIRREAHRRGSVLFVPSVGDINGSAGWPRDGDAVGANRTQGNLAYLATVRTGGLSAREVVIDFQGTLAVLAAEEDHPKAG